ncbi:C40 family peptidase [Frigidibacter mobilis]|uniref:NlpC/P60 domain-containing protein n=1 Tax=Frigidibacter mobilis TaxID=1335048 RepID=A0A159Z8N9_9RHOB|nr:C40 family peptidase [Frigidibacter mobilis]AMY71892.1 hypothetical protein AKL17_4682 [Frigidibacter mobilis]
MTDRRATPATPRIALASLQGVLEAPAWTNGTPARIVAPLADLLASPGGARDRQLLCGDRVTEIERYQGFGFVMAVKDGYCGWVAEVALGPDMAPTHRVSAPATHLYRAPKLSTPEACTLSFGARLTIAAEHERFAETHDGFFVPRAHIAPADETEADAVTVAEMFLGTPYLWGGNSRAGIDCSGLVQAALLACGLDCPGDSDQQREALGHLIPSQGPFRRGHLFFWPGHVAMAVDDQRLIHANGFRAATAHEGIETCIARIEAQGEGPLLCVKRL